MSQHGCCPQARCLDLQKATSISKVSKICTRIGPVFLSFCKSWLDQEPAAWVCCEKAARGEHQHSVARANKAKTIHFQGEIAQQHF